VGLAADLAASPERLARYRRGLRDMMARSPLRDERGFAREMEKAYRGLWRKWCASA